MAVFNSSYRNIIDYHDNLATISQNIVIMFFGYRTGLHMDTIGILPSHCLTPCTTFVVWCGGVCGVCGVVVCACGVCGV